MKEIKIRQLWLNYLDEERLEIWLNPQKMTQEDLRKLGEIDSLSKRIAGAA